MWINVIWLPACIYCWQGRIGETKSSWAIHEAARTRKNRTSKKRLRHVFAFYFFLYLPFSPSLLFCVCVCSELELCRRDDFDDKNFEPWNRYSLVANLTFDILVFHDITYCDNLDYCFLCARIIISFGDSLSENIRKLFWLKLTRQGKRSIHEGIIDG